MPPAQLLQDLIRFETVNPPGNEEACQRYLEGLFRSRGADTQLLAKVEGRPSLVVRVRGRGLAPPLLLQGHVDVVTTEGQRWSRPPFGGELDEEGWVWGRGALDMKGQVAMMVSALLRCLDHGQPPAGDAVLCCLADEEAGGSVGAAFLVEEHPELFAGVRHALGEGGGGTRDLAGGRLYPITVAEKRGCRLRITVRGPGGHASLVHRGGTVARLGDVLLALDRCRLPMHPTPVVQAYLEGLAGAAEPMRADLTALLDPDRAEAALERLGSEGVHLESMLRNTANATIVQAGTKINVIPSVAVVEVDGRLLPGQEPEDFVAEVRAAVGPGPEIEVTTVGPRTEPAERGPFFHLLGDVLREIDPAAVPVPMLMTGGTDQRFFAQLGIQGYGFPPLRLPAGFGWETVHAADERIPVSTVEVGTEAVFQVLQRYR
jgi:acetylornithine deacetylase/succinyl-diaminopimelate desuccinylase-like protein